MGTEGTLEPPEVCQDQGYASERPKAVLSAGLDRGWRTPLLSRERQTGGRSGLVIATAGGLGLRQKLSRLLVPASCDVSPSYGSQSGINHLSSRHPVDPECRRSIVTTDSSVWSAGYSAFHVPGKIRRTRPPADPLASTVRNRTRNHGSLDLARHVSFSPTANVASLDPRPWNSVPGEENRTPEGLLVSGVCRTDHVYPSAPVKQGVF